MKTLKFTVILFFVATFFGCQKEENKDVSPKQPTTLLVKAQRPNSSTVYQYDSQNRLLTATRIDSIDPTQSYTLTTNSYNAANQPTKSNINYFNQGKQTNCVFLYNSDGKLEKAEYYDVTGGVTTHTIDYMYNYSSGKIELSIKIYASGTTYLASEYFIDGANNITKENEYNTDSTLRLVVDYLSYDNKKPVYYKLPVSYILPPLSANNALTYKYTSYPSGNVTNYSYSYEYNDDGYVVKETGSSGVTTYSYIKK